MDQMVQFMSRWRTADRNLVLSLFTGGNFAGVEEMRTNDRLFERVAPLGVNDIIMAIQYRLAASIASQPATLCTGWSSSKHWPGSQTDVPLAGILIVIH